MSSSTSASLGLDYYAAFRLNIRERIAASNQFGHLASESASDQSPIRMSDSGAEIVPSPPRSFYSYLSEEASYYSPADIKKNCGKAEVLQENLVLHDLLISNIINEKKKLQIIIRLPIAHIPPQALQLLCSARKIFFQTLSISRCLWNSVISGT